VEDVMDTRGGGLGRSDAASRIGAKILRAAIAALLAVLTLAAIGLMWVVEELGEWSSD
jgi:hypothetical protein